MNWSQNERLQAEQVLFIQELIKQAKDFERQLAEEEVVDKDAVVSAMKDKWETIRQEENEVAGTSLFWKISFKQANFKP